MSTRRTVFVALTALLLCATLVRADSPLTSTDFHRAYLEIDMVKKAKLAGIIDQEIADYLTNDKVTLDVKAAVINALGWALNGKKNAPGFAQLAFHMPMAQLNLDKLDASALFCLGYLQALDDYFDAKKALPYLNRAKAAKPKSQTIAVIHALVTAQTRMDDISNWEGMGRDTMLALVPSAFPEDPLRPAAIEIIRDYMALY